MSDQIEQYLAIAEVMDNTDPLAGYREKFDLPNGIVYLDGNSLGALPSSVPGRLFEAVETEWGDGLVSSWNQADWVNLPSKIGDQIAPLIGAEENSVVVTDSTSINAFKVLSAALLINNNKRKIVSEKGNFPTDLYMGQALAAFLGTGHEMVLAESDEELRAAIDEETAVVFLTQVDYRTGRKLDMQTITSLAHEKGALVIWDLAHSAGAFPVDLSGAEADFAIGCGYKYLNGGPGAPAFLYVRPDLQMQSLQPLSGWFAHEKPFDFDPKFRPAQSIKRYLTGTPPVLSMIALEQALKVWETVDLNLIYAKSVGLSQLFVQVVSDLGSGTGLTLVSPEKAVNRGSQVSYRSYGDAYAIMQALIAKGVVGDFRAPDILRFGFAPLYNTHHDVVVAAKNLVEIVSEGTWDTDEFRTRKAVT